MLSVDTGISRQTEGHSFGDHLISGSVNVTPSSVIEASIVLYTVSFWLVWVNVQSAWVLNTRYEELKNFYKPSNTIMVRRIEVKVDGTHSTPGEKYE
jgi:hypothetical protein